MGRVCIEPDVGLCLSFALKEQFAQVLLIILWLLVVVVIFIGVVVETLAVLQVVGVIF